MDIDRIRAETPGTHNVVHLVASGSGLMPSTVTDAIVEHLTLEQSIGGYEAHANRRGLAVPVSFMSKKNG
ncbi:MAG: hypothetical protein AB8B84_03440 [Granulosicoccus sp.]